MKEKKPYFILLPALLLLLYGCVSELPFGGEYDGMPTVNCLLKNDSTQTLNLTRAVKISGSHIFKEIPDAEISLSLGDSVVGYFTKQAYATWELKYKPVSGREYNLTVLLADGTELTASTTMPHRSDILPIVAKDKFPSRNFVQRKADLPCWIMMFSSDELLLGSSRPQKNDQMYPEIGTDHPNADRFNEEGNMASYIPLADTPAFLFYIRIKPDDSESDSEIPFRLQSLSGFSTLICFQTASEEYDRYMKTSFDKILMRLDETDPLIWFDETKVFSNIRNGTGIFAAYYEHFFNYNNDNSFFE